MDDRGGVRPAVVLVGLPAAGKTTVGRVLADLLGVGFRDTDADFPVVTGKTFHQIVASEGTARLRELDEKICLTALSSEHPGVVAIGAGSVLAESVRAALRGLTVAYLVVSPECSAARIDADPTRAVRSVPTLSRVRRTAEVRCPLYERVATFPVVADGRSPVRVALDIAALLTTRN